MNVGGLIAGALGGVAQAGVGIADAALEKQDRMARINAEMDAKAEYAKRIHAEAAAADEAQRKTRTGAIDARMERNFAAQQAVTPAGATGEEGREQRVAIERERLRFMQDPRSRAQASADLGYSDPLPLAQLDNKSEIARTQADARALAAQTNADARLAVAQANAEVQNARTAAQQEVAQARLAQAQARLEAQQAKGDQNKPPSGYRWTQTGELEAVPGGPADPAVKGNGGRPMPSSATSGLLSNQANLREAERALALVSGQALPGGVKGDSSATGWKNILPNQLLNRVDPDGVDTRAAISNLGSLVIHDRSGAAVTAAEFPRLAPFIPSSTDDPATARKKLNQFVQNYRALVDDQVNFYRESGYRVPVESLQSGPSTGGAPPRITSPDQLRDLPSGSTFTAPDGSIRRKP